mmetsp:Transcript_16701/g.56434  ORF Transcript_16701/g.56434 Transcript_16701/m.56434 type:complete len:212 (-) Transcript_16701:41-676(-)
MGRAPLRRRELRPRVYAYPGVGRRGLRAAALARVLRRHLRHGRPRGRPLARGDAVRPRILQRPGEALPLGHARTHAGAAAERIFRRPPRRLARRLRGDAGPTLVPRAVAGLRGGVRRRPRAPLSGLRGHSRRNTAGRRGAALRRRRLERRRFGRHVRLVGLHGPRRRHRPRHRHGRRLRCGGHAREKVRCVVQEVLDVVRSTAAQGVGAAG